MAVTSTGLPAANFPACKSLELRGVRERYLKPHKTEPADGYHGMRFWDTYGFKALSAKVRMDAMRDLGPCMSPFNAWLFIQGLETLALRAERHVANTMVLAQWLEQHPCINWVNYPGLKTHPDSELAQKVLPNGQGGVLTFVRGKLYILTYLH
jgi:O-acetylhomoserine/O-acetylserine sulfhydrylase